MSKARVICTHCRGSGSIELTGVYAETLDLVVRNPNFNGAELAASAGCKTTAMNNRLVALERMGLICGKRFGRMRIWTRK